MLFSGMACFSPSVPASLRKGWVKNGGTLTHSVADFYQANFFFCSGLNDPWLYELLSRSLVVRHANWISTCISEQFLMPISPYTLDDHFDPSAIDLPETTPTNSEIITASSTALNPTSTSSQPVDTRTNPLKRQFQAVTADDSYPEINPRAAKKPRGRTDNSLSLEHPRRLSKRNDKEISVEDTETHQPESVAVPHLPTCSPRFSKSAPSNASVKTDRYNLTRLFITRPRTPSCAPPEPRSIDDATTEPIELPERPRKHIPSSCPEDTHISTPAPPINRPRNLSKKPSCFIINPLKASVEPVAKPNAIPPSRLTHTEVGLGPVASQSTYTHFDFLPLSSLTKTDYSLPPTSHTSLEEQDTRTAFWKRAREGYSGTGALVLSMADILQASKPSIDARLFTSNGSHYGENFGCSWRS